MLVCYVDVFMEMIILSHSFCFIMHTLAKLILPSTSANMRHKKKTSFVPADLAFLFAFLFSLVSVLKVHSSN